VELRVKTATGTMRHGAKHLLAGKKDPLQDLKNEEQFGSVYMT